MLRSLLSVGILMLVIIACKKKNDDGCTPEKDEYFFSNNKQVDTSRRIQNVVIATAENGNDIVFTYRYSTRVCPNIADDGAVDQLLFQVPAGTTSFDYNSADLLRSSKCYFSRSCFCPIISSKIESGIIKGTRINANRWVVEVNIFVPATGIPVVFKKDFVLQ
jgi:hypothetical protein